MRILSIYHGDSRIGLALSDDTGLIAALQIVKHTSRRADAERSPPLPCITRQADRDRPADGRRRAGRPPTQSTALGEATPAPPASQSNSGTDLFVEGRRRCGKEKAARRADDARAAAVILQSYLDARRLHDRARWACRIAFCSSRVR